MPQCHGSAGTHFRQTFLSNTSKGFGNNHSWFERLRTEATDNVVWTLILCIQPAGQRTKQPMNILHCQGKSPDFEVESPFQTTPNWSHCGPETGTVHDQGVGSTCLQCCTSMNFWNWLHKVDQMTLAVWTSGTGYTKWIMSQWKYELLELVILSGSGHTGSMNFWNWTFGTGYTKLIRRHRQYELLQLVTYTKWIRWCWQYELLELVTKEAGSMNFCSAHEVNCFSKPI